MNVYYGAGDTIAEFVSFISLCGSFVMLEIDGRPFLFMGGRVVGKGAAEALLPLLRAGAARSAKLSSASSIEELLEIGPPIHEPLIHKKYAAAQVNGLWFVFVDGRIVGEDEYDTWTRLMRNREVRFAIIREADRIEELVHLGPTITEMLLFACGEIEPVA